MAKMDWATFWANFSQTHLVILAAGRLKMDNKSKFLANFLTMKPS
jgi:hypothetical protein